MRGGQREQRVGHEHAVVVRHGRVERQLRQRVAVVLADHRQVQLAHRPPMDNKERNLSGHTDKTGIDWRNTVKLGSTS